MAQRYFFSRAEKQLFTTIKTSSEKGYISDITPESAM